MKPQTLRPATFDVIKIFSWNYFLFEVHQYNHCVVDFVNMFSLCSLLNKENTFITKFYTTVGCTPPHYGHYLYV